MNLLSTEDLREVAVQAAWGAAFVHSFNGMLALLGEDLAAQQAEAHADQVGNLVRTAMQRR